MKWFQFLLIFLLLIGFPLSQIDQAIDIDWLVCENSIITKLEINQPSIDQNLLFDLNSPSSFFNQVKSFFQLKNPSSILLSYFLETSPFWRPPPAALIWLLTY